VNDLHTASHADIAAFVAMSDAMSDGEQSN
jgi:hypothetical protein